ncbi:MAG: LysR substrate-binding domain-containing protein [Candidatus Hermodarchaeota archaeon]
MNIEFIRNFIKLVKYQSFSDLAKDLSISQSTLSHQISQLEKEFSGITLIDRSTRKFNLTKEGEIFLGYAEKIIELYDSCKQELKKFMVGETEEISISASTLPGSHILPKTIANFREQFPNVSFKISINNSKKSINMLKKEMVHFAGIGSFMDYDKNTFDVIKIGEDELKFICSPNHKLVKNNGTKVKFHDIVTYPFITREKGSGTRNIFEEQFEEHNKLKIGLEINDNDSIISAVSDSDYISIMSEIIAKKAEDAHLVKILEIEKTPIIAKRDIYFVKLKTTELNGLKKKFWEKLKK